MFSSGRTVNFAQIYRIAALIALCVGPPPAPCQSNSNTAVNPGLSSSATLNSVEALGKKLFFDRRLSTNNTISCADCHNPARSYADGRQVSIGINGQKLTRNAPSLLDAADHPFLFWDGRAKTLEEQVRMPLLSPYEQGFNDEASLIGLLRETPGYEEQFREAFPSRFNGSSPVNMDHLTEAIAAFERTLVSGRSVFDEFLVDSQSSPMSEPARRGWELFRGRARCIQCHQVAGHHPMFTDETFHPSPLNRGEPSRLERLAKRLVAAHANPAQLSALITKDHQIADLGRFVVTLNPQDIGLFRTPSLRNVAHTAPYMHDGSIPTVEAAVKLEMYRRENGVQRPLPLSPDEESDLVEFLRALSTMQD